MNLCTMPTILKFIFILVFVSLFLKALPEDLSQHDSAMRNLNGKGVQLVNENRYPEAYAAYREALQMARNLDDVSYMALIYNNIGIAFRLQGMLDSAEHYHLLSLGIARKLNDPEKIGAALAKLASVAGYKGDYVTAIRELNEARQIYEANQLGKELLNTYVSLGIQYGYLKDFRKAREAYRMAEELNDSLQDRETRLNLLNNLGYLYYNVKQDFDSARIYLFQAKEMAEELHIERSILSATINLGNTYMDQNNYEAALTYYLQAFHSPLLNQFQMQKTATVINLGTAYMNLGEISKAETFITQGLQLAEQNQLTQFRMVACKTMATIKEKEGDFRSAADYIRQAVVLSDSLWNQKIADRVAEIEFSHQLEKKETENQLLTKENEMKEEVIARQRVMVVGISFITALSLILLVVILRSRNRQKLLNSQLDEKNSQLTELNQTKDKFFSIIAHDLKSPFNALLGLLQELDLSYEEIDEESKKKIIYNLRKSAQNTYSLLVTLLEWAQSQQGVMPNVPQEVKIHQSVNNIFDALRTRADLKSQILINDTDKAVTINADEGLLHSLFLNLINNAIKFTPISGTIRVTSERIGKSLKICVSDTGIGIPEEEIPNLFRIDKSFRRQGTERELGTGLGLILCQEYVKLIKGNLTVTSSVGEGSSFCLTVPLAS